MPTIALTVQAPSRSGAFQLQRNRADGRPSVEQIADSLRVPARRTVASTVGHRAEETGRSDMGLLDRSAMRRAEKQLAAALEPGEDVIEFDIGLSERGQRVDCIATNRALYLVARGGGALRLPYSTIRATQGGPTWIGVTTLSGSQYNVDFGRSVRGVGDVVVQHYRAEAQKRRHVQVSWGGGGARFLLVPEGPHEKVVSWDLDEGTDDDVTTSMLVEQAAGELEVSLGQPPSLQYSDPRPGWMPDFTWKPPLQVAGRSP